MIAELLSEYTNRLKYKWISGLIIAFIMLSIPNISEQAPDSLQQWLLLYIDISSSVWNWIIAIIIMLVWVFVVPRFNVWFEKKRFYHVESKIVRQKLRNQKFRLTAENAILNRELINKKIRSDIEEESDKRTKVLREKIIVYENQLSERASIIDSNNDEIEQLKGQVNKLENKFKDGSPELIIEVLAHWFSPSVGAMEVRKLLPTIRLIVKMVQTFELNECVYIEDIEIVKNNISKVYDDLNDGIRKLSDQINKEGDVIFVAEINKSKYLNSIDTTQKISDIVKLYNEMMKRIFIIQKRWLTNGEPNPAVIS